LTLICHYEILLTKERSRMKQTELAKVLGVHQSTLSSKLTGYRPITVQFSKAVAKFLGRDWKEIFEMPRQDIEAALRARANEMETSERSV
jgi:transcriptional regulator with XRE-family HTH domain